VRVLETHPVSRPGYGGIWDAPLRIGGSIDFVENWLRQS